MRWLAVLLATLLVIVGVLQHRWAADVSAAERLRMQHGMRTAAERLAGDMSNELARLLLAFHPDPRVPPAGRRAHLVEQWRTWRARARFPQLVEQVLVAEPAGDGGIRLERLDGERGELVPAVWPAELELVRTLVLGHPRARHAPLHLVEGPAPALLLPLEWPAPGGPAGAGGAVILQLDRRELAATILPPLVGEWFGASAGELLIAVIGPDGPAYRSDPALPLARYLPADVVLPLFDLGGIPGAEERPAHLSAHHVPHGPGWRLVARHRAGSLEAIVARTRRRHLAINLGVLVLLAGSVAVMAVAARRAQRLARQQLDFVAGVTHELNTPIAAMRSAAQNLADGVVSDPAQVRRYGTLIEREGSRLSSLVAKALELAGIHAGRPRTYHREPVALAEVVDEVLAGSRFLLDEQGFEVVRELPADLPPVLADRRGLTLAVQNLIDNALVHAATGRWLAVRAAAAPDTRAVTLTVEDRGPGLSPRDLPHLFEPFYRGRARKGAPAGGSGIGLGLVREVVEAQGGRVGAANARGGGAAFTIELPAAPAEVEPS